MRGKKAGGGKLSLEREREWWSRRKRKGRERRAGDGEKTREVRKLTRKCCRAGRIKEGERESRLQKGKEGESEGRGREKDRKSKGTT